MARFQFSDGRWADLRPPSSAFLLFVDESRDKSDESQTDWLVFLRGIVKHLTRATIAVSWDGDIGDLTPKEHTDLAATWLGSGTDTALPPADGGSSASSSPPRRSARRTGARRKSPSPDASS